MQIGQTGATRAQAAEESPPRKPNIIFILADDLGYGDVGCYGQKVILTPNIDQLAAEGIRFTDAYAGSTVCAPSRCALLTGLHTGHCFVRGNDRIPLRPEDITVAEVLKKAGYTTAVVGKWGLGEPDTTGIPNRKGFDYWFGYLNQGHAHNYYPDYLWRNEEKVPLDGKTYSHDLFTREALDFVRRTAGKPFFLYLAYTTPHANNELGRDTGNGMEVPDYGPYANKDWPAPEKGRAAMITRMDTDIGKLMALLKELGIDNDTIVFFTSDNGPHREGGSNPEFFNSSGPLRGIKRDLYDGGIRVPMIVRWPGRVPAGRVSDHVWAFWDFLPTAAQIAGVESPVGLDGISMLPAILGKPQKSAEYLYWEFHEGGFKQAVRMGNWKGVRLDPSLPVELYDVKKDIAEKNNVAAQHPDVVKKIEDILKTAHVDSKEFPVKPRAKSAGKTDTPKNEKKASRKKAKE
ncbi:MAG: arylsulfatase [Candidatus Sumerlaeia bacterium]|nr:arylsulfatase [Candidatus Sumerlaeia bacterium]